MVTRSKSIRRSSREKRKVESIYEEAKSTIEEEQQRRKKVAAVAATAAAASLSSSSLSSTSKSWFHSHKKQKSAGKESDSDDHDESEEESNNEGEEDDDDDDDDDEEEEQEQSSRKKKKATTTTTANQKKRKTRQTTLVKNSTTATRPPLPPTGKGGRRGGGGVKKSTTTTAASTTTEKKSSSSINAGLSSYSKKILHASEKNGNFLVTKLLQAHKTSATNKKKKAGAANSMPFSYASTMIQQYREGHLAREEEETHTTTVTTSSSSSIDRYTPQLQEIAHDMVETHKKDPNQAQVDLINLLFRSVGGSYDTYLKLYPDQKKRRTSHDDDRDDDHSSDEDESEQEHDEHHDVTMIASLEDMSDTQWKDFMEKLIEQMECTPLDAVLLCAKANTLQDHQQQHPEAPAAMTSTTTPKRSTYIQVGVREYRKIYQQFWYTLGIVSLSSYHVTTPTTTSHSRNKTKKQKNDDASTILSASSALSSSSAAVSKFGIEFVRSISSRLIELASMNQPDIRAVATIAVCELSRAALDRTIEMKRKLETSKRQYNVAKKNSTAGGRKTKSLQVAIETMTRHCLELEDFVVNTIFQSVFMHRYRDTNPHIRAICLEYLSYYVVCRPDIFLTNFYLKYFAWMLSDKEALVRSQALHGILFPFAVHDHQRQQHDGRHPAAGLGASWNKLLKIQKIENIHDSMFTVINKFLSRMIDCLWDIDVTVQEEAMHLLLKLLRMGFLDNFEDETLWTAINLRALDANTSHVVRKYALYFVMEQLDPFDEDHYQQQSSSSSKKGGRKSSSSAAATTTTNTALSELVQNERLDSIATWVAHSLSDNDIPVEHIQIGLTKYVVESVRCMPEHKHLATNWSALLRALFSGEDKHNSNHHHKKDHDRNRAHVTKQRVLLQMLVSAAEYEVGAIYDRASSSRSSTSRQRSDETQNTTNGNSFAILQQHILDPALFAANKQQKVRFQHETSGGGSTSMGSPTKGASSNSATVQHEALTVELLRSLPKLLKSFKSDTVVLRSLTNLPQYFIPSALNIKGMKADYGAILQELSSIYLASTDTVVLHNIALALTFLSRTDHARQEETLLAVKKIANAMLDRYLKLQQERKTQQAEGSDGHDNMRASPPARGSKKQPPPKRGSTSSQRSSGRSRSTSTSKRGGRSRRISEESVCSVSSSEEEDEQSLGSENGDARVDLEYALSLCLKRLRIISKRWYLGELLDDNTKNREEGQEGDKRTLAQLCTLVADTAVEQLREREVQVESPAPGTNDGGSTTENSNNNNDTSVDLVAKAPAIYQTNTVDARIHAVVATSISEALSFLLSVVAWKLQRAMQKEEKKKAKGAEGENKNDDDDNMEEDDDLELEKQSILNLRDGITKLTGLCFNQFLHEDYFQQDDNEDSNIFSPEHIAFADAIQTHAGKIANDLRCLFPKEWKDVESPLLQSCALVDDGNLIGGFVRFFKSKEDTLRERNAHNNSITDKRHGTAAFTKDRKIIADTILPIARGLCVNWMVGNRREAGAVLTHMTGSGIETSKAVSSLAKVLKKIDPIRLLEAHMACLRQAYEDWIDSEPEEPENDRPSEIEMTEFEDAERAHSEQFRSIEQLASRLALSLGLGRLGGSKELSRALLGFVKEGIRYSFSNDEEADEDGEDELLLGSRLSFLQILGKYSNWIRRKKEQADIVREYLLSKESELRDHSDFVEVREEDVDVLTTFKKQLGLSTKQGDEESIAGNRKLRSSHGRESAGTERKESDDDDDDDGDDDDEGSYTRQKTLSQQSGVSVRSRLSHASSIRSKMTALSPLYEEESDGGKGGSEEVFPPRLSELSVSPSPMKRRKLESRLSSLSRDTITEGMEVNDIGTIDINHPSLPSLSMTQDTINEEDAPQDDNDEGNNYLPSGLSLTMDDSTVN